MYRATYDLALTNKDLAAASCQVTNYAGQRYFEEGRFVDAWLRAVPSQRVRATG